MGELYDADYFLRGKETGKSLYEDYRWLPDLTIPMALSIMEHLQVDPRDTVCDFGCARGYTVKALRGLGIEAYGVDISTWAVENSDPEVRPFLTHHLDRTFDWVIAKDVLEHVPLEMIHTVTGALMNAVHKGVFVVVPLSPWPDEPYVCPEYELDKTHLIRWDLETWADLFRTHNSRMGAPFVIEAEYAVKGIKENYSHIKQANGFLTITRKGM